MDESGGDRFSPEFRNVLDEIIVFAPLTMVSAADC